MLLYLFVHMCLTLVGKFCTRIQRIKGVSQTPTDIMKTGGHGIILKNILIIDDDIHIGNMLEEILTIV